MPYKINQTVGGFEVVNTATGMVHAKHTTRAKAEAQLRLLRALERNPRLKRKPGRR